MRGNVDLPSRTVARPRSAPPGQAPPRGVTPPSQVRPPSLPRERLLPLVDVGSRRFEELCQRVLRGAFPEVVRTALKRSTGLPQYGVDVEGFDEDGHPCVVLSAKCYHQIKAWHFKPWIDDFLEHLDGHWRGKRVLHFVLAVTTESNDDDMNDATRAVVAEMKARGIKFHLWDAVEITDRLAGDAATVAMFFNDVWVEGVIARRGPSPANLGAMSDLFPSRREAAIDALQVYAEAMAAPIRAQVDTLAARRLDDAVRSLREGRPSTLAAWLRDARESGTWERLDPVVRSRALRTAALLEARNGHLAVARDLMGEADALAEAPDAAPRALLAHLAGDTGRALAMLDGRTPQERQHRAALLIEAGRHSEALNLLGPTQGDGVTPEILRLRAVASFLTGDRDRALRLATSAADRAPGEFGPAMTLATMRFHLALAEGVRPRFGGAPNPIAAGLFRGTMEARDHLESAIARFDALRRVVEGRFRGDCEIWRLAGLLIHPDRRGEAGATIRAMLASTRPDPLAVCWALAYGMVRRRGRIKKAFGDAVRAGEASPTHLVALALMSATLERPARGAAVIVRHAGRFPEATAFLDGWRAQFIDVGASTASFPAAFRVFVATGDAAVLTGLLAKARAEDLLSGAEILANRGTWAPLDTLRARLVDLGTPRALELAAMAALNVGDADGCLAVVAAAVERGLPPRPLLHFRIKANEALGRHRPVIADLLSLEPSGGDHVDRRLLEAYANIGALDEFGEVARRVLARGGLEPRAALSIAGVLRVASPGVARLALNEAVRRGIGPELAGTTLSLASDLGAADVQRDMLRIVTSGASGAGMRSFRGPEEVVAFLQEQARTYQARFDDWLSGRSPAVVAMAGDLRTYGHLFMAEAEERRDGTGRSFPMLVRSGAPRRMPPRPTAGPGAARTPLRVDLGALLLADRLDILHRLERLFSLQVPPSLPEALRELEAAFRPADGAVLDALDAALENSGRVLRIGPSRPPGAVAVEDAGSPGELDPAVVAGLIETTYRDGHIDGAERDRARRLLDVADVDAEPVAEAWCSPLALVRFAAAGVIGAVARAAALHVTVEDADGCRRDVRSWRHDRSVFERVGRLRATTAGSLALGGWTTIPTGAPPAGQAARPPHVRCLLEVLAAAATGGADIWIEDRWVVRTGLEGYDAVAILDALRSAGSLDAAGVAQALRTLVEADYAFAPVDDGAVLAALDASPIDGHRVVETPGLTRARRRHARDARLLAHLDPEVVLGTDGEVVSEARRLIEVCGRARSLLRSVWTDGDAPLSDRRARATWIWTFLNPLDATRPGDEGDGRLRHAAAMLAHFVSLPLLPGQDLGGPRDGAERAFVEWFVQAALEPFASGDGDGPDAVAEALALIVLRTLTDHATIPADQREQVGEMFRILARRMLSFLPEPWREAVLDRHDLRARLEMATATVFDLGEGRRVTPAALTDAFARAADVGGDVPLGFVDGGEGRLRLGEGAPFRRPAVVVGDAVLAFDPVLAVLLDPVAGRRAEFLPTLQGLAPPWSDLSPASLAAVAGIGDVDARLAAFDELAGADLLRRFVLLAGRVRGTGRLDLADLEPPPVSSVLAYLAWATDGPPPTSVTEGVHGRTRDRFGVPEAARRLAGLPSDYPPSQLVELGGWLRGPEGADFVAESPLLALLVVRALAAAGAADDLVGPALNRLLEAVGERGRLFAAFVRHAAACSLARADWRGLDAEAHLALLWT